MSAWRVDCLAELKSSSIIMPISLETPQNNDTKNGSPEQGNLLKDIVIWVVRREDIQPNKRVFTDVLFSVTRFL
jgi:hypothetical protein